MIFNKRNQLKRKMSCEKLEERWTPAQFGIPWADSTHLTMSFVPDGTQIETETSQLQASLDAQMPRATWQQTILRAGQTWAAIANVNIGLINDGGQKLGIAGASQGDTRFGDIRIGGLPMGNDSLAVSIPPSNGATGTFAGDIIINTRAQFTPSKLYAVLMHEMGHVLGLDHSNDPNSVLFPTIHEPAALTAGDIASVRALYGARAIDFNEGNRGNNTIRNATRLEFSQSSSGYDGSTPMIGYGDIGSATDIDYFDVRTLLGYSGPMTFRVQTTGISLLTPRVSLIDGNGRVLQTRVGANTNGTVVTIRIPSSVPDGQYFLKIEADPSSTYKVGRYGVAVSFDGLQGPLAITIDQVMRGRYETLKSEAVDQLFKDPTASFFENDLHTDDAIAGAIVLRQGPGQPSDRDLDAVGTLSDATDVDFYSIRAPRATATISNWVLTVSLRGVGRNGTIPAIQVLDKNAVPLPARVIVNGNGQFVVQLQNIPSREAYFLRLSNRAPSISGNYNLQVNFGNVPAELNVLPAGALTAANRFTSEFAFYVARSQLFSFLLETANSTVPVTMTIRDLSGNIVYRQVSGPGLPTSGISKLLLPGEYRISFRSTAAANFRLLGGRITDPIGVVYNSPVYVPQYVANPTVPTYIFPYAPTTPTPTPYGFNPIP
ncbi:MAG: matrixin family metalloprotease [Pirellulaceae bacterium]|nr:matrixin family metalloprotease [Pirellulaceae bacterium]